MALKKTKEELDAEVPKGHTRLTKQTKVVALKQGYHHTIREEGDVFHVPEGTIMEPNCWFDPVSEGTATNEDIDSVDDLTPAQMKVELAKGGVDFAGITKKSDLAALVIKLRNDGADLA